jgi:hypothetical protein
MPIEGPIPDLGVSDLLQLLTLSRRTGRLEATRTSGESWLTLWMEDGQIVGQASSEQDLRLGRIAILREGVSEEAVAGGIARQRATPDRRLGELLVDEGGLDGVAVRELVRFQVEEGLFRVLRWTMGRLHFQEEEPQPAGMLDLRFATDSILLDAVRRVDEWRMLTGVTGEADPIPRLIEADPSSATEVVLSPVEWETLAEVDGRRSMGAIARRLARHELEVARAVRGLVAARVVELPSVAADVVASLLGVADGHLHEPDGDDPVDDGLKALDSGDVEEAGRLADRVLARHPDSAAANVLKGMVMGRGGDLSEAVRHFDRAIELDPLHEPAYFHLASTLVRRGDLGRARGVLDTFLALAAPDDPMRSRAAVLLSGLTQTLEALDGAL